MRVRIGPGFHGRQEHDQGEGQRQQEEQPDRSEPDDANAREVQRHASHDHKQGGQQSVVQCNHAAEDFVVTFPKPRHHLFQVNREQRRVNRHVKDARGQAQPGFLKTPEVAQTPAHPGVVTAFGRQSAREFTDHEGGRQAPENRKKQQDENAMAITRTGDDRFRPIRTPRHHEEGGGNKRPKSQLGDCFFRGGKRLGRNLCGERYSAQFFSLFLLGVTLTLDALERGRI